MSYPIDLRKCAEHLSGVVKFATVSNACEAEIDFAPFFEMHKYLEEAYPLVHKHLHKEIIGKAALLYTWKGTGKSGVSPLLFMAHQDVVPEGDHDKWKYPPYGGVIEDDFVWGRGSGDCKSKMIACFEVIEHLLSEGYQPDYDIYMAFGYNEEVSGGDAPSAAWLCGKALQDRGVRIGMSLDEGGGVRSGKKSGIDATMCAIGVAEKGYADFEIYRLDPGGHSSKPHKDGALDYVAKAILAIAQNQYPFRLIESVKVRYELCAPYMKAQDPELAELFGDMEANWDKIVPIIETRSDLAPLFHTTMVPTMAYGSAQANILPERAGIIVNCRLLAGDTLESVKAHIESILPEGMAVQLLKGNDPSPVSSVDTDCARLLEKISQEMFGEDIFLMPDITAGGTDSKYMYDFCDNVYRFTPFYATRPAVGGGAHAVNETCDARALVKAVEFYVELIKRYGQLG